jgi:hypothetical protein
MNEWWMNKARERNPAGYIYPTYLAQTAGPRDEDPPLVGTPGPDYHRGEEALMVPRSIRRVERQTHVFCSEVVPNY